MKRMIFTLMLMWSFIAVKANYQASFLTLSMYNNEAFTLTFDNSFFNTPSNTYNINNVIPGNHFVKVVKMPVNNPYGPCGLPLVVYSGYVNIPAGSQVSAMISGINQISMNVQPLYPVYNNGYDNNVYNNSDSWNNGYGSGYGHCGNSTQYPVYMSDHDFSMLKSSIESKSFESSKLTVAKQGIKGNKLSSRQVAELMKLFTFESTKLEIAKYAYGLVADKQNYYLVNDSFTFSSSISELDQYIAKN